jgi:ABC-type dipeptide/oligopeptide/nickel transport system permease component
MAFYIGKRILQIPFSVLVITLAIFVLVRVKGDPADLYLPLEAGEEVRAQLRHSMGLDQPLPLQYGRFLVNMMKGDFGESMWHKKPALQVVLSRIPPTVELMGVAVLLAVFAGIVLGTICAVKKGSALDLCLMTFAVFGQSMPSFWLGVMLILLFAVNLHWLPASGRGGWQHLILPTLSLMMYPLPFILLLVRSSVLEVLREDFVLVARSKGLTQKTVLFKHVLKNALNPAVSALGIQLGTVLGGAVVTESVFAWPGLGRLSIQAVWVRDMPVIQASVVVLAVWVILCNLAADITNALLDPRIRAT